MMILKIRKEDVHKIFDLLEKLEQEAEEQKNNTKHCNDYYDGLMTGYNDASRRVSHLLNLHGVEEVEEKTS